MSYRSTMSDKQKSYLDEVAGRLDSERGGFTKTVAFFFQWFFVPLLVMALVQEHYLEVGPKEEIFADVMAAIYGFMAIFMVICRIMMIVEIKKFFNQENPLSEVQAYLFGIGAPIRWTKCPLAYTMVMLGASGITFIIIGAWVLFLLWIAHVWFFVWFVYLSIEAAEGVLNRIDPSNPVGKKKGA